MFDSKRASSDYWIVSFAVKNGKVSNSETQKRPNFAHEGPMKALDQFAELSSDGTLKMRFSEMPLDKIWLTVERVSGISVRMLKNNYSILRVLICVKLDSLHIHT